MQILPARLKYILLCVLHEADVEAVLDISHNVNAGEESGELLYSHNVGGIHHVFLVVLPVGDPGLAEYHDALSKQDARLQPVVDAVEFNIHDIKAMLYRIQNRGNPIK